MACNLHTILYNIENTIYSAQNCPEKSRISPATGISDVRETRGRKQQTLPFARPKEKNKTQYERAQPSNTQPGPKLAK